MTRWLLSAFSVAMISQTAAAQATSRQVTGSDYDRAAKFLAQNMNGLVVGGAVAPVWLDDGRFWYRSTTLTGTEIVVIDPSKRKRDSCPATATECAGARISTANAAPTGGRGGRGGGRGGGGGAASSTGAPLAISPDGKRGAFVRDWNLWVRDMATA